jgi:integrase
VVIRWDDVAPSREDVEGVPGMTAAATLAPPDDEEELEWLRAECLRQRLRIEELIQTVKHQAQTIAELTGAEPGAAPSVACVYWLWAPTRWGEKSWPKIRDRVIRFVTEYATLAANEVTPTVWDRHREGRKARLTHLGAPPCDHTLNMALIALKGMLSWAVDRGMIKRSALASAKPVKTKTRRETRLEPPAMNSLLDAADDTVDGRATDDDGQRAKILTAILLAKHDSMLRIGEVLRLQRARIQPDGSYRLYGAETKTGEPRTFVFTPRALAAFEAVEQVDGNPYLFPSHMLDGQPISRGTVRLWFRAACERSGVDALAAPGERRIRLHDIRGSGATTADLNGARTTAVQKALGHKHMSSTQIYIRSGELEDAHEIARVMSGERRGPHLAPRKKAKRAKNFSLTVKRQSADS